MNKKKTDPRQLAAMRLRYGQKSQARQVGTALVERLQQIRETGYAVDVRPDDVTNIVPATSPITNT